MLKFLRRSFVILLLLSICLVIAARSFFARSLPKTDGSLTLAGLDEPVEIVRDEYGVPHIYAKTDADMMFALGFVHSQDRLYQMEQQRRVSSGTLAAMWGEAAVPADRFLLTLGFYKDAQTIWQSDDVLTPEARADLTAYAAGVNAFLDKGYPLPPEFALAKVLAGSGELSGQWSPVDSIAWLKVMSLDLGANFRRELSRLHLATQMEEDRIAEFYTPYPGDAPFILPDLNALFGLPAPGDTQTAQALIADVPFAEFPTPAATLGSNNWVIDGSLMESGASVLSNDPHLGLGVPAVWYFAHISSEESSTNAIGATFPGFPAIVIGRNDHIAWGFTNVSPDVQDTFVERINASDGTYETPTGWEPLAIRNETIEVAGGEDIELVVRTTRHGPIMSDIIDVPAVFPGDEEFEYGFAMQWTTTLQDRPDTTANAATQIFRAKTYEDFLAGAEMYVAPQQNMVVLEESGRIGYIAPALVPVRKPGNMIQGWAPSPGWDALYDWDGFIPFAELPQTIAPAEGFVITANEKITPEGYEPYITQDWSLPLRANRIRELTVDQGRPLTMEDMELAILDQRINSAAQVLPAMLAHADLSVLSDEDRQKADAMFETLSAWASDGAFTGASEAVGPAHFFTWYRDFVYGAADDDLGVEMTAETAEKSMFARLFRFNPEFAEDLVDGTASHWCDDGQAQCRTQLAQTLVTAHDALQAELGGGASSWTWQKLHHAHSGHQILDGQIPAAGVVKFITGLSFEIDRPHGGGPYSVNVSGFPIEDSLNFEANHTASLRLLVEAGKFEEARFVHTQGQSGLPQSPHFDDMADLWAAGEFAPMVMDRQNVEEIAEATLLLQP